MHSAMIVRRASKVRVRPQVHEYDSVLDGATTRARSPASIPTPRSIRLGGCTMLRVGPRIDTITRTAIYATIVSLILATDELALDR